MCQKCGTTRYRRTRRKWWMRVIPGSKYYKCYGCDSGFMKVFGRIVLK